MKRFLARLLVRLLRTPEVQAELRQAANAQRLSPEQMQALLTEGTERYFKVRG